MHIDGQFNGDIHSSNTVEIGKHGTLQGEVKAQKLVVAGKFLGNAECETIELMDGGNTKGKLTAANLAVDYNSSFQGESILKNPNGAATNAPKAAVDLAKISTFSAAATATTTTTTTPRAEEDAA